MLNNDNGFFTISRKNVKKLWFFNSVEEVIDGLKCLNCKCDMKD